MSFGFGVGDIIRLTEEAWKLYKGYKDSSEHFAQLAAELQSLYVVLAEISETLRENDNGSGKDSEAGGGCGLEVSRRHRLEKLQDGCRDLLRDLQAIYHKYESLGTQQQRAWDRVRFGLKDLSDLRARLVSSTTTLTAWKVAVIK
jgi:DNA-binding transcriptional MerR regulator